MFFFEKGGTFVFKCAFFKGVEGLHCHLNGGLDSLYKRISPAISWQCASRWQRKGSWSTSFTNTLTAHL